MMAILIAGCGGSAVPPIGNGPDYRPPPGAHASSRLTCGAHRARTWIHLELFRAGKVVVVPAGIGIAPPRHRAGAYVTGGRCRLPLYTEEPTGLIGVARDGLTLGDLFAIWGRPLTADAVHVDGHRWDGPAAAVPLHDHAQIVVQTGPQRVTPHAEYRFPPGR
jgi:hypothetical protein